MVEVTVEQVSHDTYHVIVRDTDADMVVPVIGIYHDVDQACAYARKCVS